MLKFNIFLLSILLFKLHVGSQVSMYHDFDGDGSGQYFGYAVDLDFLGNTFVGGAPSNTTGNYPQGYALAYHWDGKNWVQKGNRVVGDNNYDQFGISTAIDSAGNRLVVGANENGGNGIKSGQAKVFEWNGQSWSQMGSDILGEAPSNELGKAVDINSNGNRVAVGAPFHSSNLAQRGHVRILEWDGINWNDIGQDIRGLNPNDQFGCAVSLSQDGNWVAIGGAYNDDNGSNAGHVRVYQYNGLGWIKKGSDILGEAANDNFGYDVALNAFGNRLIVGAPNNDGNGLDGGHVRIFEWDGLTWQQLGQEINSEGAGDKFGISVAINDLGDKIAVGAVYNNGVVSNCGHIRFFYFDGSNWVQQGIDIDGEASGDSFGRSVSLNASGSRLLGGANGNDGSGYISGHARLFSTCGSEGNHVITSCGSFNWVDGSTYTQDTLIDYYYLQNAQNCDSVVSLDLTINSLPPVNFNSNINILSSPPFAFQFNNLTGNLSDYTFNWDFGDGTSLQSNNAIVFHEYDYNGLYSVSLSALNMNTNCTDTLFESDFIYCTGGLDPPTGLTEQPESPMRITPNPASDYINIIVSKQKPFSVCVFNSTGQIVLKSSNKEINVSHLATGYYTVQLSTDTEMFRLPFLKN